MSEFKPAGMNKRIDYTTILFLQVNRVNTAQTVEERALAINNLESLLYHYILDSHAGKSYVEAIETTKGKIDAKYAVAKQKNPMISERVIGANTMLDKSDMKYKRLICLIGEIGLLPKSDLEYDEAKDAVYLDGKDGPGLGE